MSFDIMLLKAPVPWNWVWGLGIGIRACQLCLSSYHAFIQGTFWILNSFEPSFYNSTGR